MKVVPSEATTIKLKSCSLATGLLSVKAARVVVAAIIYKENHEKAKRQRTE